MAERGGGTRPTHVDRAEALRRATFLTVIWIVVVGAAGWFASSFLLESYPGWRRLLTILPALAALGALWLARSGRERVASWMLVSSVWVAALVGAVTLGGIHSVAFDTFYVAILLAALLLGGAEAVGMAVTCGVVAVWLEVGSPTAGPASSGALASLDGSWIAHSIFFVALALLLTHVGRRVRWALQAADRTEAVLVERNRELEASRERLRVLTESCPDLIAEADAAGRLIYVSPNHQAVLGVRPEDLLGRSWTERIHPEDREEMLRAMSGIALDDATYNRPFRVRHANGCWRWIESDGRTFLAADGTMHVVSVNRDVTEKLEIGERLAQSQKLEALGQLAAGVAHDFNNLLTVILGCSEILLDAEGKEGVGEEVRLIDEAARRGEGLTRQLLAFGRRQVLRPRIVEINESIASLRGLLERTLGEHVEIEMSLWAHELHALVDPTQLEQIVVNLAVNARDAMPGGGRLRISTFLDWATRDGQRRSGSSAAEWAVLAIADEGVGMDPEVASHVFEPFFTTKPAGDGSGLGLATVHGIVEQSAGFIELDTRPAEGSEFRVYLPLRSGEPETATGPSDRPPCASPVTGNVLVVEDDDALRHLVERVLRSHGYRVTGVRDGMDALRVLESSSPQRFDLLLSDMVMPRMGGVELGRQVAARSPETRILFMSGYSEHPSKRGPRLDPSLPLLEKPFSPRRLVESVSGVLGSPRRLPTSLAEAPPPTP